MRPELDEQLCERYPHIFGDRNASMTTTAMCWGFECGDGWFNLIDQLCSEIQSHVNWSNRTEITVAPVVAVQVKEKFGTLNFYYDGGDDIIDGMVRMAEALSSVTCETCGAPATTRGQGWRYTSCDLHAHQADVVGDKDE
jgi:hypothetical protein